MVKAHPKRFRSLSAYLAYCGLKAHSANSGRFSHHVRGLYHQLVTSVIMHKDHRFYPLYLKTKADLRDRFPEYPKYKIKGMVKNRVATFIAKAIYYSLGETRAASTTAAVAP